MTADEFEQLAWKVLLGDATAEEQATLHDELARDLQREAQFTAWQKLVAFSAENLAALHTARDADAVPLTPISKRRLTVLLEKIRSEQPGGRRLSLFSILTGLGGVLLAVLIGIAKFATHELPQIGKVVAHTGSEIATDAAKIAGHAAGLGRRLVVLGLPVSLAHAIERDDLRQGRLHNTEDEARRLVGRWQEVGDPPLEVLVFTSSGELRRQVFVTADGSPPTRTSHLATYTRAGQELTIHELQGALTADKIIVTPRRQTVHFYLTENLLLLQSPAGCRVFHRLPEVPPFPSGDHTPDFTTRP